MPAARTLLEDTGTDVLVSAASAWEIATKYRLGKLPAAAQIVSGYIAHLATLGARELPVASAHALVARSFAIAHRDPFDRMLAAQAIAEGIPIVTADPAMSLFPGLAVLW